ncbi:hypothetical protein [uncultured Algibacter sp.]|uniref:hypothetical protein n=1 Tax=uncultured Algibacter sp. TaxID=298659 RepID=UPI0026381C1C|nr:hypothetical protein [uncultured Algibacter sp.]
MKLKLILLSVLLISVLSCSSDSNDNPDSQVLDDVLVKQIVYAKGTSDEYINTFNYDSNKLTSVDYGDGYKNVYTYDGNNNLIKDDYYEENILTASIVLEYNSQNVLTKSTEIFYPNSGLDDRQYENIFTYNPEGTITKVVYIDYFDSNAGFELAWTETISYSSNNIIEIAHDDGFTETYTYDNENNAFQNIHTVEILNLLSENEFGSLIFGNTNNVISFTEDDNSAGDNYNDTYEYTYNNQGFPITGTYTSKYGNQVVDIETLEFIYQ